LSPLDEVSAAEHVAFDRRYRARELRGTPAGGVKTVGYPRIRKFRFNGGCGRSGDAHNLAQTTNATRDRRSRPLRDFPFDDKEPDTTGLLFTR
jgi:hypothetical protein